MFSKIRVARAAVVLAAMLSGVAGTAQAATIAAGSTINFAGQSSCTTSGCTFGNAIVTSGTGSFANFTFGTAATFLPLAYDPFTPQVIYTTTNAAAQTASFFTSSRLSQSTQTVGTLTSFIINDAGVISLTGFDSTAGAFLFTSTQNGGVLGSFSVTADQFASAAPEPATWGLMILGFGLAGGAMRRRKAVVARAAFA